MFFISALCADHVPEISTRVFPSHDVLVSESDLTVGLTLL